MRLRILTTGSLLLLLSAFALADSASTVRETVVRSAPDNQSKQLTILPTGQSVDLKERQGGWYRIELADARTGWLPLLSVRKTGATPKAEKSSGLRSLLSSFRTGSSGVTVATGVRGLDAVDLKNSKPDMDELKRIANYVCSDDEARAYAAKAGLVSRKVAWLPEPDARGGR